MPAGANPCTVSTGCLSVSAWCFSTYSISPPALSALRSLNFVLSISIAIDRTARYTHRTPEHDPQPARHTLEEMLEGVIFAAPNPHVQALKAEWAEAKRREQEEYERVCRLEYEGRLMYHQLLKTPDAEYVARGEASACRILFMEDRDRKLAAIWSAVLRKVDAVLKGGATRVTTGHARVATAKAIYSTAKIEKRG